MESLDPGPGPRALFAERFALLYAEAGDPPLKRVSESVARVRRLDERGRPMRVTAQRVSDWRRGRNVPARFATLATVLEMLIGQARWTRPRPLVEGLYDLNAWRELWEQARTSPVAAAGAESAAEPAAGTQSAAPAIPEETGACPYRGLAAFRREDSGWFFGRERCTNALLVRLTDALPTGGIVTLVGASGAGKSSLIRAGLVQALAQGALPTPGSASWPIVLMTPGADPLAELGNQIPEAAEILGAADAGRYGLDDEAAIRRFTTELRAAFMAYAQRHAGADARVVLVVDQFEEAFTLGTGEGHLRLFMRALHAACTPVATGGCAPALAVLGVRADFYGQCLYYPELAEALQDRQLVLGPMTASELRDAVVRPAKAVGLQLEAGLVELLVRDLGASGGRVHTGAGQGAYDAGALPLLSHALLATWQRRQAGKLTISGYRSAGGIHGAVSATAERAWGDLDAAGQVAARQVLLRLVRVGADTQDTRRRSTRHELLEQAENCAAAEEALEVLARARLLTLDAGSVEITHEALLQAWPRLRSWIDLDRASNLLRQRLEEDAQTWHCEGQDSSLLYRGTRLAAAQQWAGAAAPAGLTAAARRFLATSARHRRRTTLISRAAVAAVVVFALIAGVAAAVALRQRDDAIFAQVLAEADRVADTDPSLSAQLNLVAHHLRQGDEDVYTRLVSTQNAALATPLIGHGGAVYLTSFRPDGNILATASYDRTVRLWDLHDRTHPVPLGPPLTGHTSWVSSAVFSPDGQTLATAGDDKTVRLWDVRDPAHPVLLGQPVTGNDGTIYLLAFSPDGHTLATADEDHTARLWDVHDPAHPAPLGQPLTGHDAAVRAVAFSPDGHALATGSDDKTVRLWNLSDATNPTPLGPPLVGHTSTVHSVAFSPDGHTLATGSDDKTVRLWNLSDATNPTPLGSPLVGHTAAVWSVAFSPDGQLLATGSADSTARLWNLADPANVRQLGQPLTGSGGGVFAVAFSPDGRMLTTGSQDGVARLWSLPMTVLVGHASSPSAEAFSHDGHILATGSRDKTVRLWNVSDPTNPTPLGPPLVGHTAAVWSVAFSPDSRILATLSGDKTVRLWNVTDPTHPMTLGQPIVLNTRYSGALALSPHNDTMATSSDDETSQLWSIRDPVHPIPLGPPLTGHTGYVNAVAFSPDGDTLATGSSDKTVRLWNVSDPAHPIPLGPPLTGHTGAVNSVAYSPDGHTLATGSDDQTVRLWNLSDPAHPIPLGSPLTGHTETVTSTAFSADGRTLAAGGLDSTVVLWNVTNPAHPTALGQSLTGHTAAVNAVAFSPNGYSFATVSSDDTTRLWDLDVDHVIARICATTRGILTPQQWQRHIRQLPYDPPCE